MLALLLRTDEPAIPPPKTVPPKKTETTSHITKTQMGPADALVQKISYNLSAFHKAASGDERKKYAGWISSDLAELGRMKMKKGEREQAMERISQMVSEVERAPWLVGTKIGALEQIVKGLLDAGPKWKSVREKAENALAGQIRYLSVEEKNTTAEAKVELLVHTEPRVALQPAVFNAINKSCDEQTVYFSLVENDVWEASIWARDYQSYSIRVGGVELWPAQIRYDPPRSELVTEQWARDQKRDDSAWPSGDSVPAEKLPLRMVEMTVHYFEAQVAAAKLMGKSTDNPEIKKLAVKLESEADSRLVEARKLGGTPQDRRQALLLLVEYQHNHLEPGLSKMETEKYFADLYKLAGNTFWKKALVWAHEHAETGMLWTALGMGAINPFAGRLAFIMMGSRDVVKGVESKDWNRTIVGTTIIVGLGGFGRVSQVAGGVLVGQVISGAVEQLDPVTQRDWENLLNSAVLLEGFFRARMGEIGRRVRGKLKKVGKPKKTEAKTKTPVQKTEETKAKETAPKTEKEVQKTEETAQKTEKATPKIQPKLPTITTTKEPLATEQALEQRLQQIYGESKMPPYLNYINMLLGGYASRENFGVLAGKTILDLGCGSRQNPDASLKAGKYEPWLCRSLFETKARVTGIDNMAQNGELFPSMTADLSKPGVLNSFADNSVDLINASALLSNYRYEYPSTNIGPSLIRQLNGPSNNFREGQANYNKMEDEIFAQAGRILKEGGWFVLNGGSTLYQKKNGQLVMQRQGDMPGGFDAWFKGWEPPGSAGPSTKGAPPSIRTEGSPVRTREDFAREADRLAKEMNEPAPTYKKTIATGASGGPAPLPVIDYWAKKAHEGGMSVDDINLTLANLSQPRQPVRVNAKGELEPNPFYVKIVGGTAYHEGGPNKPFVWVKNPNAAKTQEVPRSWKFGPNNWTVQGPDGREYIHSLESYDRPVVKRQDGTPLQYQDASKVYGGAYAQSVKRMAGGQNFVVAPIEEGFRLYVPERLIRNVSGANYYQEYVMRGGVLEQGRRMTAAEVGSGGAGSETKSQPKTEQARTSGAPPKTEQTQKTVQAEAPKTKPKTGPTRDIFSLLNDPTTTLKDLELARKHWLKKNPDALKAGTKAENLLKDINQAMQKRRLEEDKKVSMADGNLRHMKKEGDIQMTILGAISKSDVRDGVILQGGTAVNHIYGGLRKNSPDIDYVWRGEKAPDIGKTVSGIEITGAEVSFVSTKDAGALQRGKLFVAQTVGGRIESTSIKIEGFRAPTIFEPLRVNFGEGYLLVEQPKEIVLDKLVASYDRLQKRGSIKATDLIDIYHLVANYECGITPANLMLKAASYGMDLKPGDIAANSQKLIAAIRAISDADIVNAAPEAVQGQIDARRIRQGVISYIEQMR